MNPVTDGKTVENFYVAFESRHRGSRELIKSRLRVYEGFVQQLKSVYEGGKAIDLGCGRGEWLELVSEQGFDGFGVDLDDGMLGACHERGLKTARQEAVAFLKTLADESVAMVTGFHIVEHIPFQDLQNLVKEAHRVLLPGGLLIMETPNPENIIVATRKFYLDPTHQRPIPPELLLFIPEYFGFFRTKILRLQESKNLMEREQTSLYDVLDGASPDYAVVAQKTAETKTLDLFQGVFGIEYGLKFETLVDRFDHLIQKNTATVLLAEAKTRQVEAKAQEAEEIAQQAEVKAQQAEVKAQLAGEIAGRAEIAAQHAGVIARQAEDLAHSAREGLSAIHDSRSWRLTRPLRLAAMAARWFVRGSLAWLKFVPGSRPRRVARKIFLSVKLFISNRPKLKSFVLKRLANFPKLWSRLRHVGERIPVSESCDTSPEMVANASPRALEIHRHLQAAMERNRRKLR